VNVIAYLHYQHDPDAGFGTSLDVCDTNPILSWRTVEKTNRTPAEPVLWDDLSPGFEVDIDFAIRTHFLAGEPS
jgi:hypothetical protein